MEQKIKIIIADESKQMRASLREYLPTLGADVVCEAETEEALMAGIKNFSPDIVLMDMWLGKSEAASIFKKINTIYGSEQSKPSFIVFSASPKINIFEEILDFGASYCMPKPIDYDILGQRIQRLCQKQALEKKTSSASAENNGTTLESAVTGALHKLGVSANIKGYLYLRTAIILRTEKTAEMSSVTKALYPAVAKIYGTTPACVERAMRHAIATAWERGDLATLNQYFGNTIKNRRGKPTNGEFISMISEHMKMKFNI